MRNIIAGFVACGLLGLAWLQYEDAGEAEAEEEKSTFVEEQDSGSRLARHRDDSSKASCPKIGLKRVADSFGGIKVDDRDAGRYTGQSSSRVAVCMTGQARSLPLAFSSWKSTIFPLIQAGKDDLSIDFFYVGQETASYSTWRLFISSLVPSKRRFTYKSTPVFRRFGEDAANVLYRETEEGVEFNTLRTSKIRLRSRVEEKDLPSSLIQLWQGKQCKILVSEQEKRGSFKYKRVARVRTDAIFRVGKSKWKSGCWRSCVSDLQRDLVLSQSRPFVIYNSDYLYVMPRFLMDRFLGSLDVVERANSPRFPKLDSIGDDGRYDITALWQAGLAKLGTPAGLFWMGRKVADEVAVGRERYRAHAELWNEEGWDQCGLESGLVRALGPPRRCYYVSDANTEEEQEDGNSFGLDTRSISSCLRMALSHDGEESCVLGGLDGDHYHCDKFKNDCW